MNRADALRTLDEELDEEEASEMADPDYYRCEHGVWYHVDDKCECEPDA